MKKDERVQDSRRRRAGSIDIQSRLSRVKSITCDCQFWRSHSSYSCWGFMSVTDDSFDSSEIVPTSPWLGRSASHGTVVPPTATLVCTLCRRAPDAGTLLPFLAATSLCRAPDQEST